MKNLSVKKIPIVFFAITACLLWSTSFAGIKIGLTYSTPLSFAGVRFTLVGIILLPFCGSPIAFFRLIKDNYKSVLAISFLQLSLLYGLFYTGINLVPSSLAAIIIGSSPLFVAVSAHFFIPDDKINARKIVSIILGILGITIISIGRKPWSTPTGISELIGILLLCTTNVSSSIGNIIVARHSKNLNPIQLNSAQNLIGGSMLLVLSLFVEGPPLFKTYPSVFYVSLMWLIMVTAVAYTFWYHALKESKYITKVNIWKFMIPVLGAVLSWILIPSESPNILSILGMLFVTISLIVLLTKKDIPQTTN